MRRCAPTRPTPKGWDAVAKAPANLLDLYPVGVLLIDNSELAGSRSSTEPDWSRWLKHIPKKKLPRVVLELCSPATLAEPDGGRDKGRRKQMLAMSYYQRCALVSNTDEGGAVASNRLITSYLFQ
jgi:hypothetical protein